MATVTRKIDPGQLVTQSAHSTIAFASAILKRGRLVAFPTETVYGLAANALDPIAVQNIFAAKQRPAWDPLIVHVASWAMLDQVVAEISPQARSLMRAFWPGPLTLLLPRSPDVPDSVTAGRPLVAVRWPSHPVAQALILAAECPLAAPSANLFSHVSPTTAQHVLADLDGRIDCILDGGATTLGLESAVVDPNTTPATLYRPGTISIRQLQAVIGPVCPARPAKDAVSAAQPSPGMELRHYAPQKPLRLVHSQEELAAAASGKHAGVLLPDGWQAPAATTFPWGPWNDIATLGERLYAGLRWLDAQAVEVLICPLPAESENTAALRDRLLKAAR